MFNLNRENFSACKISVIEKKICSAIYRKNLLLLVLRLLFFKMSQFVVIFTKETTTTETIG